MKTLRSIFKYVAGLLPIAVIVVVGSFNYADDYAALRDGLTLCRPLGWLGRLRNQIRRFWLRQTGKFLIRCFARRYNAGRRDNPLPRECGACRWIGRIKNASHGYGLGSDGDVEPVTYCPRCESEL